MEVYDFTKVIRQNKEKKKKAEEERKRQNEWVLKNYKVKE